MRLLDANLLVGPGRRPARFDTTTPEGAVEFLDFFGIDRALVRGALQEHWSAEDGNRWIVEYCAGSDRLMPVWTLLPFRTGEFPPPERIPAVLADSGVKMVSWAPKMRLPLEEPVFSRPLLEALAASKIPLLYPLASDDDLVTVGRILSIAPELVMLVSVNRPAWGLERYTWPLFDAFPNLVVCTSGYHVSGAVQATVEKYGAGRFVFGSGYPTLNPGGAVEFLARLDISEADREAIAEGNMLGLLNREKPS
jgi:hypothetical protein